MAGKGKHEQRHSHQCYNEGRHFWKSRSYRWKNAPAARSFFSKWFRRKWNCTCFDLQKQVQGRDSGPIELWRCCWGKGQTWTITRREESGWVWLRQIFKDAWGGCCLYFIRIRKRNGNRKRRAKHAALLHYLSGEGVLHKQNWWVYRRKRGRVFKRIAARWAK